MNNCGVLDLRYRVAFVFPLIYAINPAFSFTFLYNWSNVYPQLIYDDIRCGERGAAIYIDFSGIHDISYC